MNIRTHTCGELKLLDCEKSVYLNGWVNTVRLHGQVVFVDLRDRYGKTQVVFNSEDFNGDFEQVKNRSLCCQNGNIKPCRTVAICNFGS